MSQFFSKGNGGGLFRKHRRSPSHFNLKYGRENSPPDSPVKENHSQSVPSGSCIQPIAQDQVEPKDGIEVIALSLLFCYFSINKQFVFLIISLLKSISDIYFLTCITFQVDPNVHRDFLAWRQSPTLGKCNAFVARVYREDIDLCLDFNNRELAERVEHAVETGNIYIEAVGDRSKTAFPK